MMVIQSQERLMTIDTTSILEPTGEDLLQASEDVGDAKHHQSNDSEIYATELKNLDVLFGRGSGPNEHHGNRIFRDEVKKYQSEYLMSSNRKEKTLIAKKVIAVIKAKNGRFLKRLNKFEKSTLGLNNTAVYAVVDDEETVLEKTRQTFRYLMDKSTPITKRRNEEHSDNERPTKRMSTDADRIHLAATIPKFGVSGMRGIADNLLRVYDTNASAQDVDILRNFQNLHAMSLAAREQHLLQAMPLPCLFRGPLQTPQMIKKTVTPLSSAVSIPINEFTAAHLLVYEMLVRPTQTRAAGFWMS